MDIRETGKEGEFTNSRQKIASSGHIFPDHKSLGNSEIHTSHAGFRTNLFIAKCLTSFEISFLINTVL